MRCSGFMNHEENIQKSKTMKIEKLKIANEIQAKIKDLKEHKDKCADTIIEAKGVDLRLIGDNQYSVTRLRPEVSPVSFNQFIESYTASIDAEIKTLEVKLEML